MRVVYVSYDGMTDPLGQSQVIPYLEGLAGRGHEFDLISFEKLPQALPFRRQIHPRIRWTGLRYHSRPTVPATAWDVVQGAAATAITALARRADLVHVRSYVPALLALGPAKLTRTPLLFDMRGLWPDERVEAGAWKAGGRIATTVKSLERALLRHADGVTVLTNAMAEHLRRVDPGPGAHIPPIQVIPTCADLDRFSPGGPPDAEVAAALGRAPALIYLGALGGRYLMEEMAEFYLVWRRRRPGARFLVVSRDTPTAFREVLGRAGVGGELLHFALPRERVPGAIRAAECGIFFYRGSVATKGVAPTKLGEILACGRPVIGNGVGDVSRLLGGNNGVLVDDFCGEALDAAAGAMVALVEDRTTVGACRATAERWFSLERGVEAYDALYRTLGARRLVGADLGWPREIESRQGDADLERIAQ